MTSFPWLQGLACATLISLVAVPLEAQNTGAQSGVSAPTAVPALNGKLRHVRLFESSANIPAQNDRIFQTKFEQARTRYVNTELTFDFAAPGRQVDFKVECAYLTAADSTLGRPELAFSVKPEWVNVLHHNGWGYGRPAAGKPARTKCAVRQTASSLRKRRLKSRADQRNCPR